MPLYDAVLHRDARTSEKLYKRHLKPLFEQRNLREIESSHG